ncbi:hypothetical protein, partial [Sansalvadorimonas verongulae]|uniref:hypothetical protein n=1 Tax=Sansalvadorimonas verongulae TaxID=2172824 RepID=UPI001E46B7A3
MCHVPSGEEVPLHIHCSPLPSGHLIPSRFPHLNAWVRKHYRELQIRTDDDRPADSYDKNTLRARADFRLFICDFFGCNKYFTTFSDL